MEVITSWGNIDTAFIGMSSRMMSVIRHYMGMIIDFLAQSKPVNTYQSVDRLLSPSNVLVQVIQ